MIEVGLHFNFHTLNFTQNLHGVNVTFTSSQFYKMCCFVFSISQINVTCTVFFLLTSLSNHVYMCRQIQSQDAFENSLEKSYLPGHTSFLMKAEWNGKWARNRKTSVIVMSLYASHDGGVLCLFLCRICHCGLVPKLFYLFFADSVWIVWLDRPCCSLLRSIITKWRVLLMKVTCGCEGNQSMLSHFLSQGTKPDWIKPGR